MELNRAVAVAMVAGPEAGLELTDGLGETLADYPYLHATRADLLRRLGRWPESAAAYEVALRCTTNGPERAFLRRRLAEVRDAEALDGRRPARPG